MVNGLRGLRTKTNDATLNLEELTDSAPRVNTFLIIMIIGTFISLMSLAAVLYQVWMIDRNKAHILSLYALLQINEIKKVHSTCETYLEILNQGSLYSHLIPSAQQHPGMIADAFREDIAENAESPDA